MVFAVLTPVNEVDLLRSEELGLLLLYTGSAAVPRFYLCCVWELFWAACVCVNPGARADIGLLDGRLDCRTIELQMGH